MALVRLKDIEDEAHRIATNIANKLADDAKKKLTDYYASLIERYYSDNDYKLGVDKYGYTYYDRTYQLRKSYSPYKKWASNNKHVEGGVYISADKMKDYDTRDNNKYGKFAAEDLLSKFIIRENNPVFSAYGSDWTWHGGDWHGGYGVPSKFSIYNELSRYRDNLLEDYKKGKYEIDLQEVFK